MSKFKTLKEPLNNTYSSYPYRVPVNIKALQHTKIKELQIRMMRWSAWVKDERIPIENWIKTNGKIGLPLLLGVGRELEN